MLEKKQVTAATVTRKTRYSNSSYHKSVKLSRATCTCRPFGWFSHLLLEAADRVRGKGKAYQANHFRRLVTEHQESLYGGSEYENI